MINMCSLVRPCSPVRAASIQQALSLLAEWRHQEWELPKLILLDLYLPTSADGWHLLKAIKAMSSAISLVPIVMLSSSGNAVDIEKSYSLGISAYVVKPTQFTDWQACFQELRSFWWETTMLPPLSYGL